MEQSGLDPYHRYVAAMACELVLDCYQMLLALVVRGSLTSGLGGCCIAGTIVGLGHTGRYAVDLLLALVSTIGVFCFGGDINCVYLLVCLQLQSL